MKKIALTCFVMFLSTCVLAQTSSIDTPVTAVRDKKKPADCPSYYITTSSGINNNTGLLGLSIEKCSGKNATLDGGLGWSTWGLKVYAGFKIYTKPCQRGWAFGSGLTLNCGGYYVHEYMEGASGLYEDVTLRLLPQLNLIVAAYHYWNLGHARNRWYTQFGWVCRMTNAKYRQVSGTYPLNQQSGEYLYIIDLPSLGGPIMVVGFSFGAYRDGYKKKAASD